MSNPSDKQFVTAIVRRIIFAGLALLGAWLLLYVLRGMISERVLRMMAEDTNPPLSPSFLDTHTWDWTRSLWTNEPVAKMVGERLGVTFQYIGTSALISLVIAAVALVSGRVIGRITVSPGWLAKLRSILRLAIISRGASAPFFAVYMLAVVYILPVVVPHPVAGSQEPLFWATLFLSVMPAWLLVQSGHGEMTNRQSEPGVRLAAHMFVYMLIRVFRLIGLFIVINIAGSTGLGRLSQSAAFQRDFPLLFYTGWILVIIVVLVRLLADLIELAWEKVRGISGESSQVESRLKNAVPKWWLILCLALAGVSIIMGIAGPSLAPHFWNEIDLQHRLAPPGPGYLLGADNIGRDILSRILTSLRIDVLGAVAGAIIVIAVATGWAILAALLKGLSERWGQILEDIVLWPLEVLRAFPWLALLMIFLSVGWWSWGGMVGGLVPTVMLVSVVLLQRIVAMILEAGRSLPDKKEAISALLPAMPVAFFFTVAGSMLYISAASYIGMGVPPPYPELGSMLSGAGRQFMMVAPWMALWPAVSLSLLLFIWVMAGDALLERLGFRSKAVWSKTME